MAMAMDDERRSIRRKPMDDQEIPSWVTGWLERSFAKTLREREDALNMKIYFTWVEEKEY